MADQPITPRDVVRRYVFGLRSRVRTQTELAKKMRTSRSGLAEVIKLGRLTDKNVDGLAEWLGTTRLYEELRALSENMDRRLIERLSAIEEASFTKARETERPARRHVSEERPSRHAPAVDGARRGPYAQKKRHRPGRPETEES